MTTVNRFKNKLKMATVLITLTVGFLSGCASTQESASPTEVAEAKKQAKRPIVIAHRGASGYLPEHTIEAYVRGMELGADFIEPDLVMTKDGVLVARHENEISETTNVGEVFPERKTTKTIEDVKVTGWFVEDFTFDEIRKLKAKQRLAFRPQMSQLPFLIPTLAEIIDVVDQYNEKNSRKIGIIPEIKHSSYFRSIGLDIEKELLKTLEVKKWNKKLDQVYIQSFEVSNLKELARTTSYSLVQLLGDPAESPYDLKSQKVTYNDMVTLHGLKDIRKYAGAIGPFKRMLIDEKNKTDILIPNDVLKNARLLDFQIFPYTFRNETFFLLKPVTDPLKEYEFFYKMGVDGVFSDFPDTAVKALKSLSQP